MHQSVSSEGIPITNDHRFTNEQLHLIKVLRAELKEYVDRLFAQRQKDFINFIENDLQIEEQIDPSDKNVINTFYKNHNTVNKMYDNFRLCKFADIM